MTNSIEKARQEARAWLEANVPTELSPDDGPELRAFALAWQKCQAENG